MGKHIILKTIEDYADGPIKSSFTQTTDTTTMPANSYAFNNSLKALRVNDGSTSVKGSVMVALGNLFIGDTVEIIAEVMNLSGTKVKIALDYSDASNLFILQSEKTQVFEKIGGKFVITKNLPGTVSLGVFTADTSDFYIRNVEIKVHGGDSAGKYKKSERFYSCYLTGGVFEVLSNFGDDKCTAVIDSANKQMVITHASPFVYKSGVAQGNISATADGKLILFAKSESVNGFTLKFFNISTLSYVDPATLNYLYFTAVHHGYELI